MKIVAFLAKHCIASRKALHCPTQSIALLHAKHCINHCLEFVELPYLGLTEVQNGMYQAARAVSAAWAMHFCPFRGVHLIKPFEKDPLAVVVYPWRCYSNAFHALFCNII